MFSQVVWDAKLKLRRALFRWFVLAFLMALPVNNQLLNQLVAILPKAKTIESHLYYSLNKINHKSCKAGEKTGSCMFVWECMKSGGHHGGMCMDGFMFGSCCIHDGDKNLFGSASSSSNIKTSSNSIVSSGTSKPYYHRPSHQTGLLRPFTASTSYLSAHEPAKESATTTTHGATTHSTSSKWTKPPPPITIPPPAAPTRPTRPTKPSTTLRPAIAPWWAYASKVKKPVKRKTTAEPSTVGTTPSPTTALTSPTTTTSSVYVTTFITSEFPPSTVPSSPLTTLSTTKPPPVGPFTTNVHSKHVCGIPRIPMVAEGRIVNGTNSRYGEFPWQTSVRRTSFFGFSSTHRCGGALLNSRWVATAGHCVDDLLTSQIRLRVGEFDFSSVLEPYPYVERKAKKKVVHPNYNFFTYEYDLALVEMESDIEFQPNIQPICLPGNQDLLIGEYAKVTGWGRLSEHGTLPSVLQQTTVPIMSNDACQKMFLKGGRKEYIPDIFLCAGYENGGRDSCQGDSGGPLQVKGADGRWFLAGIISWGIGCAEPNLPGVCTRISKFVPFILEHVT